MSETSKAYGPPYSEAALDAAERTVNMKWARKTAKVMLDAAHDPALGPDRSVVAGPYEAEIARLRQALQAITSLTIPTLDLAREIARDALNAS